jgi:chromosome transmission fidelity protein 18
VIDQEIQKVTILRESSARQARFRAGNPSGHDDIVFDDKENAAKQVKAPELPAISVKKDFFGRIIKTEPRPLQETDGNASVKRANADDGKDKTKVWVTFHEGLNNAVRKPISLDELLRGL